MDSTLDSVALGTATHPLDPLSEAELAQAARIARNALEVPGDLRFEMIELKEPARATVRDFEPGRAVAREARVNVYSTAGIGVWRCLVSLSEDRLISSEHLPEACPMIQLEEFELIEEAVKADPRFIEGCRKRGIEDMSLVCADPWSGGSFGVEEESGRHVSHTFAWVRTRPFDNQYAHPIEGLNAVVDIKTLEVIRVDDHGVVPIPMTESNYDARFVETPRPAMKPIDVVQPEGVSFALEGHRLTWQDWSVRLGFNAREGLTLHDLGFHGRSVLFRASIAEMVVPYGSPHPAHARKNVFDIGEYGIGKLVNSLTLGCDCLGAIQYLDAWISDYEGKPSKIENAICIHEEDYGVLWKHWDFRTDHAEVRRARRLVISTIATVGNYEYGYYWYLYLDGTVEFEMKATGIINTVGCRPGERSKYGVEVAPGVMGQIHQHVFCAKLDLAIDGDANSAVECNTRAEPPGPENPFGNAFFMEETPLASETGRKIDPSSQRYWKFVNPNRTNAMGRPVAYKLEPSHCVTSFLDPGGPSGKRSRFTENHLWITAADSEERFPGGEFMNHSTGEDGVVRYAGQGRNTENTEIVAWHVFGLHHLPRLEDYPVQPCVMVGFMLKPNGFFDRNPTLDLPRETNKASRHAEACCPKAEAE